MKSCVRMYEINVDEVSSDLATCRWRPISAYMYLVKFNSRGKKNIILRRDAFIMVDSTCPYYTDRRTVLGC